MQSQPNYNMFKLGYTTTKEKNKQKSAYKEEVKLKIGKVDILKFTPQKLLVITPYLFNFDILLSRKKLLVISPKVNITK